MTRMYDRPTLGPDGWVVDETPTPAPLAWSLDSSGNPVGLVGPDGGVVRVQQTLLTCGTPIGIACTGSMAANGALTLGTALNATYSGGLWLYLPSGAVYSGSAAGFYWTVMSSTTLGTVYDNIYVPGTNSFDIPASPTAISAAGPGAFTGSTAAISVLVTPLHGGFMGDHGSLTVSYKDARPNTAGAKTVTFWLGASNLLLSNSGPNCTSFGIVNTLQNLGSPSRQGSIDGASDTAGASTTTTALRNIDTAVDQTLTMKLQLAVATDYAIMYRCMIQVTPS